MDEVLQDNFTFRRNKLLKDRPTLENGFFSVQQSKETQRAAIPKFASLSKGMTKPKDDLGRRNFLKGREISLPEATDPDATNKLYLEDFYTGESDDLLDVTSDKDIEYYMSMKASNGAEKGVPYSQKDLQEKDMCPWELMLELKTKTSQSEKTDDTTSSNYYEVLHYNDSIQSSSETDKSSDAPSLPVKRIKKFPIAKPLPEVPPKVPLQNLFNHPPLRKKSDLDKTTSQSCDNVTNKSFDLDKGTKYNTYSSLHSVNREKRKLENQEKQKYMSLGRSSVTKKWRKDAREIDFQIPKRAFKGVRSPKLEAKRRKMYGKTEKENQHFNIMLNSELLKLKKFFQEDDETETDESTKGQTNDGYITDNSDEVFHTDKSGGMDNPVTLIL